MAALPLCFNNYGCFLFEATSNNIQVSNVGFPSIHIFAGRHRIHCESRDANRRQNDERHWYNFNLKQSEQQKNENLTTTKQPHYVSNGQLKVSTMFTVLTEKKIYIYGLLSLCVHTARAVTLLLPLCRQCCCRFPFICVLCMLKSIK